MKYFVPMELYQEVNCVKNHSKDIAALGKKALLVTGRNSAKICGALDDVLDALQSEGVEAVLFDQVEENPSVETVMKARDFGVANQVDFVIGIGGGSPLDAAKAIAVMILHDKEDANYLYASGVSSDALPIVAIPTTCGTGSEATAVSVLTLHDAKTKVSMTRRVFPTLSLVDATYIKNAPWQIVCNTAMDAFAHLVESLINTLATDYTLLFAREGLRVWGTTVEALKDKALATDETFENLMLASTYAGMAIAHTGTALPHGLSYPITYEANVPHGKAVGFFVPAYIKEASEEAQKEVLSLTGFASIEAIDTFFDDVCGYEKLDDALIERAVESVLASPGKLKAAPFEVDKELLYRMTKALQKA